MSIAHPSTLVQPCFLPTSRLYAATRKQLLVSIGLACLNRGDMVGVWVIDLLIQKGGLSHE
jgi:hypothetical protein